MHSCSCMAATQHMRSGADCCSADRCGLCCHTVHVCKGRRACLYTACLLAEMPCNANVHVLHANSTHSAYHTAGGLLDPCSPSCNPCTPPCYFCNSQRCKHSISTLDTIHAAEAACAPVPACLVRRRSPRCFSSFSGGGMISQLHIAIGYRWPGCLAFASSCRISSTASASKVWGSHRPASAAAAAGEDSFLLSRKQQDHPVRCQQCCSHCPAAKQHVKQADAILQPANSLTSGTHSAMQWLPDTLFPEVVLATAMQLSACTTCATIMLCFYLINSSLSGPNTRGRPCPAAAAPCSA